MGLVDRVQDLGVVVSKQAEEIDRLLAENDQHKQVVDLQLEERVAQLEVQLGAEKEWAKGPQKRNTSYAEQLKAIRDKYRTMEDNLLKHEAEIMELKVQLSERDRHIIKLEE